MPEISREEIEKIAQKYKRELGAELGIEEKPSKKTFSREYLEFKKAYMPKPLNFYEKLCNISENILHIKPDKKKELLLREAINICHMNITPSGAISFSFLAAIFLAVFGSLFGFLISGSFLFVFFFIISAVIIVYPLQNLPTFFANSWRMKASNQMILSIFYIVTFMRHTSNLELALEFASDHLSPPLSLDLKKVLWDVETSKFSTVMESLDNYLETWKKWNREYIESFHLIESSLYEGDETRRLELLDKALDVILEETYEKMLHYAHNLKSPITMLHMLGIIMPILGLVILPLIVSFMTSETITPKLIILSISFLYNLAIPFGVFYLGKIILSTRPSGYGSVDISEENPAFKKYRNVIIKLGKNELRINPIIFSLILGGIFLLIGLSPVLLHALDFKDFGFGKETESSCGREFCFMDYRMSKYTNKEIGPYGFGASIISLFFVLGIGFAVGLYYKLRSINVIKIRENTKKLETEFASGLFQLGGRLGEGIPAEMAFGRVSEAMEGTMSGKFFSIVDANIRRLGVSIKEAIFNKKFGALVYYPSKIIESSMKVFIESIKKGPRIAAQALMNISRYIKEIHRVNERLKDLLADIISSMKSQIKFLTPVIAGIVVGITSMITTIIGTLSGQIGNLTANAEVSGAANLAQIFGDSVPSFYFQIIVGIYVVEIIFILTILSNAIENGEDKLNERYLLGVNLIKSTSLYAFVSLFVMLAFNFIASKVMLVGLS